MIPSQALSAVTASELARAATMFTTIKQLRLRVSEIDEKILDDAFEAHVQSVLEKLNERLPQIQDSCVREAEVLMAKHGLFDAGFQQAILLCHTVFPALGDSLKDIRSNHSSFISEFYRVIDDSQHSFADMNAQIHQQAEEISSYMKENASYNNRIKVLDKEAEELRLYIDDLRQELRDTNNELNIQREAMKFMSSSSSAVKSSSSFEQVKPFVHSIEDMAHKPQPKKPPHQTSSSSLSSKQHIIKSDPISSASSSGPISSYNNNKASKYAFTRHPSSWLYNFRSEMQIAIDSGKCRELSINECKDVIIKLYDSKAIANDKALKGVGSYPPETMEQHIYRLYEKKFGLRTLAVEQAGKLFSAIQHIYSNNDDNGVVIFYKIFKNEIEEDFRLVQQELLRSIYDLIMIQLVARFPMKDQASLQKLLDKKTTGSINEAEWTDIMNYLYDDHDSIAICMILKQESKRLHIESQHHHHQQHLDTSLVSKFIHEQHHLQQQHQLHHDKKNKASFSHEDDGLSYLSSPSSRPSSPSSSFIGSNAIIRNMTKINPVMNSQGVTPSIPDMTDHKRLGYRSTSLKAMKNVMTSNIPWKEQRQPSSPSSSYHNNTIKTYQKNLTSSKDGVTYKLSFEAFVKIVLDFQLHSHERYLQQYRDIFHEIDEDCDGILNIREFYTCYNKIRQMKSSSSSSSHDDLDSAGEELETFATIVRLIDPMETDIITFSASATALSKVGMKMNTSPSARKQMD